MMEEITATHELNVPRPKMPYALRFAVIATLLSSALTLIYYFIGQDTNRSLQWVGMVIPITAAYLCLKSFKEDSMHRMTGGEGFRLGMLYFLLYAVFMALFTLLYIHVINPDLLVNVREIAEQKMEDRGLSDEMIEQQMKYAGFFFKPAAIVLMGFISNIIFALIVSGILSLVMRTPRQD